MMIDVYISFQEIQFLMRNHNHYSRKMHRQWSHVPPPTGPLYTKEQLLEVRRVTAERIQAEKLRKMGFTLKESMGVRYE